MEENESFQNPISLEELQLLIHHPSSSRATTNNEDPVTSLSHIPWTFQQSIQITSEEPTSSTSSDKFPAFSYLDLRRHQNRAWANDRLLKGNEQYYLNPEQADKLYQEGIDLVPDHVDLLVAQAKLWLMRRSRLDAAKLQLKIALDLDATHADANHWMNRLERHEAAIAAARRGDVGANHQAQTRNSTAYQNVLMERNLLLASQHNDEEKAGTDASSSSSSSHRRSKRQKKTKQKKKPGKHKKESKNKGRKRRRRYDSSSASDESSKDASTGSGQMGCDGNEEEEEEKGDVPTRTRKRRRQKRYYSDASSTLGDDESVVKSSRNRGRKERDRQTDESLGDDDSRSRRRHKKRSRSYREKAKHRKKHRKSEIRSDSPRESNSG